MFPSEELDAPTGGAIPALKIRLPMKTRERRVILC